MNADPSRAFDAAALRPDFSREPPQRPSPTATSLDAAASHAEETDFEISPPEEEYSGSLGRYAVERELARGGMGVVLLARDDDLGRKVAIKLILKSHQHKPDLCHRFVEEARVTGQLQHPGIVPIYEMGHAGDGRPYFAMKLVVGRNMSALLADAKEPGGDRWRLLKLFEQVSQTLAYAHSEGVIHLDLKPANVMIGAFGEVHVMDWGLSRVRQGDLYTRSGWLAPMMPSQVREAPPGEITATRINGTPAYMAPEQARGDRVDARSDVFGLGAVLCEILTGSPPYCGNDVRQVYGRAANASLHEAISCLDACETDRPWVSLAKRCLSPRPDDRPADAGVVAREAAAYLESALEQAESDLSQFFELSLDLFCIASLDGYFKRVNANFYRVLGYSAPQLVTRPFADFIHPDDRAETERVMRGLALGQPVVRFRNRYRRAQGDYRRFEWTAKSVPAENVIFVVARDVTEPD